jgi:hypothetical protein
VGQQLRLCLNRDHVQEVEAAAIAHGWSFARFELFLAKVWDPKAAICRSGHWWTLPFFDMTLYDTFENLIFIEFGKCTRVHSFRRDDLLPTRLHTFGPLPLPIPHRLEFELRVYQPEWDTWPISSVFCHRHDTPYPDSRERIAITASTRRFPLFNVHGVNRR